MFFLFYDLTYAIFVAKQQAGLSLVSEREESPGNIERHPS